MWGKSSKHEAAQDLKVSGEELWKWVAFKRNGPFVNSCLEGIQLLMRACTHTQTHTHKSIETMFIYLAH